MDKITDFLLRFTTESTSEQKIFTLIVFIVSLIFVAGAIFVFLKAGIVKGKIKGFSLGYVEYEKMLNEYKDQFKKEDEVLSSFKKDKFTDETKDDIQEIRKEFIDDEIDEKATIEYQVLEEKFEVLNTKCLQQAETIQKLNKKLNKYSIDKTSDYISFEEILQDIQSRFISMHEIVCQNIVNKKIRNLNDEEFKEYIIKLRKKFVNELDEEFLIRYTGHIVTSIESFYKFLGLENGKNFDKNYTEYLIEMRKMVIKSDELLRGFSENMHNQIRGVLYNFKKSCEERYNEIHNGEMQMTDEITTRHIITYILDEKDLFATISNILALYKNLEKEKRKFVETKQKDYTQFMALEFSNQLEIIFKQMILKKVEEENINLFEKGLITDNEK